MDINEFQSVDLSTSERYRVGSPRTRRSPWFKRHLRMVTFMVCVVVPMAAVTTYFFAFAAHQYVSEAKFVVRGATGQAPGVLSSLLQSTGMARAEEDTYAVQDYILSRDALVELQRTYDMRALFARPEADRLSIFPLVKWRATFEHLYEHYLSHVDVVLDSTTGVSTIKVKTFRPEDSERVATALLAAGEGLVNRMNGRQRENAMRESRKDVAIAEDRVQGVATQIAAFRNREAVLDPTKQSVPMLAQINDLQTMLSRTNLQLAQLVVSTPRSPLIADLHRRVDALQGQIKEARSKITGTDASLVPKITAFDSLELQREFAEKQLASAIVSLETARIQADHQQLYLDTIVKPNVSDYPAYPKRFADVAIALASLLGVYVMAALLIAGAREHRFV